MKKIIAVLLSVMLCVSLFACSNNPENPVDDRETSSTINDNTIENYDTVHSSNSENDFGWELLDLSVPQMPDLKTQTVSVPGASGVKVTVGATPFNYNISDFEEIVCGSKFLSQKYNLGKKDAESIMGKTFEEGNYARFVIKNEIVGSIKGHDTEREKDFNDMVVSLSRNTRYFSNYDCVSFCFKDIGETLQNQREIYELLKACIGEEYAKYLVFAEGSGEDIKQLRKNINTKNVTYCFERNIYSTEISFKIYAGTPEFGGVGDFDGTTGSFTRYFDYYGGEHISVYDGLKYKLNSLCPNITDFSAKSFDEFANEYFKVPSTHSYSVTTLSIANLSHIAMQDGRDVYSFKINASGIDTKATDRYSPSVEFEYTIVEKDGNVNYIDVDAHGDLNSVQAPKDVLDTVKKQLFKLFPYFSNTGIKDITLSDSTKITRDSGNVVVLGKECEYKALIEATDNYGRWEIELYTKM